MTFINIHIHYIQGAHTIYMIQTKSSWCNKRKPVDSIEGNEPNSVNEQPLIRKNKKKRMKYTFYNLPFSKYGLATFFK